MRHPWLAFHTCIVLLVVLSACTPSLSPQTAQPPVQNEVEAASTSLVPVDLAGPEMKVGSTWLYVDGSLLVAVPAGPFSMGQGRVDNPIHQVSLSDFWIYRTKVTNAQYANCVAQEGCTPPNVSNNKGFLDLNQAQSPVVGVTYDQAAAYCSFVHGRLPTEAEWEKAARGPDANIYPWGDQAPACDLLNFDNCAGGTTPVNQYPQGQSYYTAFDMEGNTFEWAADWYQTDYYSHSPADDPTGPEKGSLRSVRSSAFNSGGDQTPAATRFFSRPEDDRTNLGFRCVVEDPAYFAPFCEYPATYGTDGIGGASAGTGVEVNCPDMSITQNPTCAGTAPLTFVNVTPPSNGLPSSLSVPPGCQPISPLRYSCFLQGKIEVCGTCTVKLTYPPQCPDQYTYDEATKKCIGTRSAGTCLPGFTAVANASGQCCTVQGGTAAPTAEPLSNLSVVQLAYPIQPIPSNCPSGTWPIYDNGSAAAECLSLAVPYPYCKTTSVDLNACQPQGGACKPLTDTACEQKCNGAGHPDPANPCSCICTP